MLSVAELHPLRRASHRRGLGARRERLQFYVSALTITAAQALPLARFLVDGEVGMDRRGDLIVHLSTRVRGRTWYALSGSGMVGPANPGSLITSKIILTAE
jgi:hypothetical protein